MQETLRVNGLSQLGTVDRQDAIQLLLSKGDSTRHAAVQLGRGTSAPRLTWLLCCSHTCVVCCEDYQGGDVLRELRCKHRFHLTCIDRRGLAAVAAYVAYPAPAEQLSMQVVLGVSRPQQHACVSHVQ